MVIGLSFCKGSQNNSGQNSAQDGNRDGEAVHSSVQTDSAREAGLKTDSLKLSKAEKYDQQDSLKKDLPLHSPPGAEKIDSIKKVKSK